MRSRESRRVAVLVVESESGRREHRGLAGDRARAGVLCPSTDRGGPSHHSQRIPRAEVESWLAPVFHSRPCHSICMSCPLEKSPLTSQPFSHTLLLVEDRLATASRAEIGCRLKRPHQLHASSTSSSASVSHMPRHRGLFIHFCRDGFRSSL